MTIDDSTIGSFHHFVPEPPIQQEEADLQPHLAQLPAKHRQQFMDDKTSSASVSSDSVPQITTAAMRDSRANRPPHLTQEDLTHLTNPVSIIKSDWRFVEVHSMRQRHRKVVSYSGDRCWQVSLYWRSRNAQDFTPSSDVLHLDTDALLRRQ